MRRGTLGLGLGALLYGAIALGANTVLAADLSDDDRATLKEMRTGDMRKLVFHKEPRDPITAGYRDIDGNERSLDDYRGSVVVVNFWATWCPPCRAEMPSIDRLAGAVKDNDIKVVAISVDRTGIERVAGFFEEIGVENLPVLHDQKSAVARAAGALGLPVTIILDQKGREVARLQGEAEWDSADVQALLIRLAELTAAADT